MDDLATGAERGLTFDVSAAEAFIAFFEQFLTHTKPSLEASLIYERNENDSRFIVLRSLQREVKFHLGSRLGVVFCCFEKELRYSLSFLFATINIVSPVFTGVSDTKKPHTC